MSERERKGREREERKRMIEREIKTYRRCSGQMEEKDENNVQHVSTAVRVECHDHKDYMEKSKGKGYPG